jgi:23S rRNA pseudouridine1911/1915/1917 synthase
MNNTDKPAETQMDKTIDIHYPEKREEIIEYHAPSGIEPIRIDVYLTSIIKNATRNKVQNAIESGYVTMNGKIAKASHKVQPHDHIICRLMKRPPIELLPENIPLDILYEDDEILVVNKAAGMVVHPAHGNRYGTLVNAVLYHLGKRESVTIVDEEEIDEGDIDEGELFDSDAVRPGIVHRIDKDTSGILVIGKTPRATEHLSKQFAKKTSQRVYHALVWGIVKHNEGTIDAPIGRSPRDRKLYAVVKKDGREAITDYKVIARYDFLTHVEFSLRTGRTHQIRVHCAHLHHPLLSDTQYGGASVVYGGIKGHHRGAAHKCLDIMKRQALHAAFLGFIHPKTGKWMEFTSAPPQDFQEIEKLVRDLSIQ